MKRVLTALILISLVLLVLFKAPLWLFTIVVGVVAMAAAREYLKLVDAFGSGSSQLVPLSLAAVVFIVASVTKIPGVLHGQTFAAIFLLNLPAILMLCAPLVIVALAMLQSDLKTGLSQSVLSAFVFPYVVWSLMTLVSIREYSDGVALILFLFVAVWSGDVFAYYVGRAIGKHKLAPRISPGKTWEGAM